MTDYAADGNIFHKFRQIRVPHTVTQAEIDALEAHILIARKLATAGPK